MLEFENLSVMVSDVSMARMVLLFTEGFTEPFRGILESHKLSTSMDAMNLTRDLQNVLPRTKYPPQEKFPFQVQGR